MKWLIRHVSAAPRKLAGFKIQFFYRIKSANVAAACHRASDVLGSFRVIVALDQPTHTLPVRLKAALSANQTNKDRFSTGYSDGPPAGKLEPC